MRYFEACIYEDEHGVTWPGKLVKGVPSACVLPDGAHFEIDQDAGIFRVSVPVSRVRLVGVAVREGRKGRKRGPGVVTAGGVPVKGDAVRCERTGAVGWVVHDCEGRSPGGIDLLVQDGSTFDGNGGRIYSPRSGATIRYAAAILVRSAWAPHRCWHERGLK